jgi:acyl-coenzyme A synthetase/AMP-(fatty) acid ligase
MPARALWDDLLFQARLRPGSLAAVAPTGPVGFATLIRDVEALATELLAQGLAAGDMVGVNLPTTYLHLLVILALDRLGVASMSFPSAAVPSAETCRLLHLTTVISGHAAPVDAVCRWIALPEGFRLGRPDTARLAAVAPGDDPLVRVVWSSGTGGGAKGAAVTRRIQAQRLGHRRLLHGLGARTRYLANLAFSGPSYVVALATLAAGGAVILPRPGTDWVTLANTFGATLASAPPVLLAELLGALGGRARRLETVECLEAVGAHLPQKLAADVRLFLTPHLHIHYGTTETAQVASADAAMILTEASAAGHVLPWVDVEAIDPEARSLPRGREGELRIRSPGMIAGYYRNDDLTRRNFRDGWFHTGDVGVVTEDGALRVLGRVEDVIVRGGATIAPLPIEEVIRGLAGVRDVAVFPLRQGDGPPEICAALVLDESARAEVIQAGATARLGDRAPARMFRVEALPRNASGKVLRTQLVDWALRRARG